MLPSHERLDRGHLFMSDGEQRLVSKNELGALDGAMQLHLHREALHRALIDRAVMQIPAVSAEPLAGARRGISGSEKASDFTTVLRKNRDADARGDKQFLPRGHQRLVDPLLKKVSDADSIFDMPQVRHDEHELVATEAGKGIGGPNAGGEAAGQGAQNLL